MCLESPRHTCCLHRQRNPIACHQYNCERVLFTTMRYGKGHMNRLLSDCCFSPCIQICADSKSFRRLLLQSSSIWKSFSVSVLTQLITSLVFCWRTYNIRQNKLRCLPSSWTAKQKRVWALCLGLNSRTQVFIVDTR